MENQRQLTPLHTSPLRGIRKTIASRLGSVWREAVHVTLHRKTDVTGLYEKRRELAYSRIDYVLFAIVQTLKEQEYAAFNSHFDGHERTVFRSIHLGLATDHPKGLIVPNLFGTEAMDMATFAARRRELIDRAKRWKHAPDELENGTFTVSNLGTLGVDWFTPILNPPQVAIMGLGRTQTAPVYNSWGEAPELKALLPVSLTVDHRVLDGAIAARFLSRVEQHIAALASAEPSGGGTT